MDKGFYNTYRFIKSRKRFAFIALTITILALLYVSFQLKFEEDITKLIPADEKTAELQKILKTVSFTDKIIVKISKENNGSTQDITSAASIFLDSLKPLDSLYIESLQGRIEDADIYSAVNTVYNNVPLFLTDADYKTIARRITPDSIKAITQTNYKTLLSPSGIVAKKTILKDPLGLSFLGLKKLHTLGVGDDFMVNNGFVVSKDGKHLLLFINPKHEIGNTDKNTAFSQALYKLQNQLNSQFQGKANMQLFGGSLIAVANAQQIKTDIQFTVGIAVTVLLIVFMVFYRQLSIPIILFVPTLFGALLAGAVLYLLRTQISAISLGIGAVLLGVTLDYALHILTHLRNNRQVKDLYREVTKPILMSSITTALAFLCLLFINSQALQDLGIFAAVSVLGAAVMALLFIPQVYKGDATALSKHTVLDKLARYKLHKNKWVIMGVLGLMLVSAFTYNKVTFNNDIAQLNYQPKALLDAQQSIESLTNLASKSVYVATYNQNTEKALQQNDSIFSHLQILENNGTIESFNSIGALVQSDKKQQQHIERWKNFWTTEKTNNLEQNLITSGAELGFKPDSFQEFYALLRKDFQPIPVETYNTLSSIPISEFISENPIITTITSLVKLKEEQSLKDLTSLEAIENTLIIDRQQLNERLLGHLKDDFNYLILYSLLVVLVLLFLFYRSFSLLLVTSIPILLSWLLTIGMMGLFGMVFNIFNIIIATFIFGLGVDYAIFVTNGLLKELRTGEPALATYKTSILLSVITTILGIGVLIFAKHPALYTISVVCMIGILSAVLVAFTIQPLLFKLFIGSKHNRPTSLRVLLHSAFSLTYYVLGGVCLSFVGLLFLKLKPSAKKASKFGYHKLISNYIKSVLYTNPFVKKRAYNSGNINFSKPGIIIANHTSFLDTLSMSLQHDKVIYLVNDWVYHSPIFGKAVQLAGFYPVSQGIDSSIDHLRQKVAQGFCIVAFPEGKRSETNRIKRFHKGAFFLSEQLDLDIIPVLIHGDSEVMPRDSYVIKDGSITVETLPRISSKSDEFGDNYTKKSKAIGKYFRKSFREFRLKVEGPTYFHRMLLEDYRYKGGTFYRSVKADVKANKNTYHKLLHLLDEKAEIIHISEDFGQLDFLLALDAPERKIRSVVEDQQVRLMLKNSYITNAFYEVTFVETIEALCTDNTSVVILNTSQQITESKLKLLLTTATTLVYLKMEQVIPNQFLEDRAFQRVITEPNLIIFKKAKL